MTKKKFSPSERPQLKANQLKVIVTNFYFTPFLKRSPERNFHKVDSAHNVLACCLHFYLESLEQCATEQ